jgi:Rrf2 family protein
MLDLALRYGEGPVFLKAIAKRQDISEKYLWQLIFPLKRAGLIISSRGAHGGYELSRAPKEITLKDIVCVLEGSVCLVDCVESPNSCKRSGFCVTRDIWAILSENVLNTLKSFTLEEMVNRQKKKNKFINYSI